MSHLSSLADKAASRFVAEKGKLKLGKYEGRDKLQKVFLFLGASDLFDKGHTTENRIYLNDRLKNLFLQVSEQYKKRGDWNQIVQLFCHFCTASLRCHGAKKCRESIFESPTTSGSRKMCVRNNTKCVYLISSVVLARTEPKCRAKIVDTIYMMVMRP